MADRILGGRYRVERMLGRGGMAIVWRAWDLRLDRAVAVKILDQTGSGAAVMLEQLHREARAVARLAHPNIVAVHDLDTDGDTAYLVMELVDGRSLADVLAGGPLAVGQAVAFAGQICQALAAAHAAGVVHRDVKPGNLMVTHAGVVKVCDFGIARLQHAATAATHPAVVMGTSAYMAPEQAAGEVADARTDLYALGCVLYAMLTGAPPFVGDDPVDVLYQHRHHAVRPPSSYRDDVAPELDRLVQDLLAKDPSGRPASAAEAAARLSAVTGRPAPAAATVFTPGVAAPRTVAMPALPRDGGPAHTRMFAVSDQPDLHNGATRPAVRPRTPMIIAVVAVLALATATAIAMWAMSGPPAAPVGQPATSATPPASPSLVEPARSLTPAEQIAALQTMLTTAVGAGALKMDDAEDLRSELDEVARNIAKGQDRQAAEKVAKVREKLDELHRDGKLSPSGYETLAAGFDALVIALPSRRAGNGDD